ncbi:DeoR/GlpR family DNA-binding transcription regulator [Rothia sp. CCM 9418]|uniref:DeoR/GlpR family DNA-binding transcription regulator n=1 Tax=Rothia sp. CCM 9418 TaxID=3402661 RepID=UPI003AEE1CAA
MRSQRHAEILELLNERQCLSVNEIIDALDISAATARRDLDYLASEGLLQRTRGGAQSNQNVLTNPMSRRESSHLPQKTAIARAAIEHLQPGMIIGFTGGSTVGEVARELSQWVYQHQDVELNAAQPLLTVVTNAVDIAYALAENSRIKIVLIGGEVNSYSYEITGPFATDMLKNISLDLAFIGVNGFDQNGPGTVNEYEAMVNSAMATRAEKTFIVADSSKFGKRSFSSVGGVENISEVITDSQLRPELAEEVQNLGYNLKIVDL